MKRAHWLMPPPPAFRGLPRTEGGPRERRRTFCRLERSRSAFATLSATAFSPGGTFSRSLRGRRFMPEKKPAANDVAGKPPTETQAVGCVLGSVDATPLDFWIGVRDGAHVQLDDLIMVE